MFSPNVRNKGPWRLRHLTIRFVSCAGEALESVTESVDASMYCSFKTSFDGQHDTSSVAAQESLYYTHKNSDGRVVIRILHIIRYALDDAKQIVDEAVIHQHQVVELQTLNARHLVHQLQQQAVQTRVLVFLASFNQL